MTYLGKKVKVKIPERDNFGKINGKLTYIVGICQSEPRKNEFLDIALQVIVDRMPIEIKSLNDIQIL